MAGVPLYVTRFGPESVQMLAKALADVRGGDRLAPVTVAVKPYAGLHLRRRLASLDSSGMVNIGFMPLARIAELAGASVLASRGLHPASRMMRLEIIRAILDEAQTLFEDVRTHPSTVQTLLRAFEEMRPLEPGALEGLASGPRTTLSEAALLFRQYRKRLEELQLYDETDLLQAAAGSVRDGGRALKDLGHVILHLPSDLKPAEAAFARALARSGGLAVVLGVTGNPEADQVNAEIAETLGLTLEATAVEQRVPDVLVTACDAEEEVREVIRQVCLAARQGVPLYRMAVTFRHRSDYLGLVYDQFELAGVLCNGGAVATLGDTPPGHMLRGLVNLKAHGLPRTEVMDWLSAGQVRIPEKQSAAFWDRISRLARVTRGLGSWVDCLTRFQGAMLAILPDEDAAGYALGLKLGAEALVNFIESLDMALDWKEVDSWSGFSEMALGLMKTYGKPGGPLQSDSNLEQIESDLRGLAALEEARKVLPFADFAAAVENILSQRLGRHQHHGAGVAVGSFDDLAGLEFDRVFILGMKERSVPAGERHDPVMPPGDRQKLGLESGPGSHTRRELRSYLAAAASGTVCSVSFPVSDWNAGRENLPSRWFLEAAGMKLGRDVLSQDVLATLDPSWHKVLPSLESGILSDEPGSGQEYCLRSGLLHKRVEPVEGHWLFSGQDLRVRLEAETSRYSDSLTRWDGQIGKSEHHLAREELSPTLLETFARCPRQYLYKYLLGVQEYVEPNEDEVIDNRLKGMLIHNVLCKFHQVNLDLKVDKQWGQEDREYLLDLFHTEFSRVAPQYPGLFDLLVERERASLERALEAYLVQDNSNREETRAAVWKLEYSMGQDDDVPRVSYDLDGRRLLLGGRVDRIDRTADGGYVIYDYKTGQAKNTAAKQKDAPGQCLRAGQVMQLAYYAQCLRKAFAGAGVRAAYYHVCDSGSLNWLPVDEPGLWTALDDLMVALPRLICQGLFPAIPDGACRSCSYAKACPADRERIWESKSAAGGLQELLAVIRPSGEVDEEAADAV